MSTPLGTVEAEVKAKESALVTFVKTNWAHFVTWLGIAYALLKHL